MKYQVLRQHYGDKQYFAGDVREIARHSDADYLIKQGLIAPATDKTIAKATAKSSSRTTKKSAPKLQNKMADDPANKAEQTVENKDDG